MYLVTVRDAIVSDVNVDSIGIWWMEGTNHSGLSLTQKLVNCSFRAPAISRGAVAELWSDRVIVVGIEPNDDADLRRVLINK